MAEELKQQPGAFVSTLRRANTKIREDRATMIAEDAETMYRRKLEDIEMSIKQLKRTREAMMDLSPSDANSLTPAKDFKASEYVATDLSLTVEIRQLEIQLEEGRKRFDYLFTNQPAK